MVDDLQKSFDREDELIQKILRGGDLTDAERSFETPRSLRVCAGSVRTDEGLERIQAWFNTRKVRAGSGNT